MTAASATAVTADELMDLFYSLKSPYRKNAVWILNDSTIKAIRKLKDNNGQYLWQPSLVAGTPDTILWPAGENLCLYACHCGRGEDHRFW